MENPLGVYTDEYHSLQEIAQKWKIGISNQYLTRQECTIFHRSFFLPSMRYHLTVGTFMQKQLSQLQHPIIQTLLPRMEYNANMPKAIIYGPISSGSMGFSPLHILKGTQKIKYVLQAYRSHSSLKNIFHITFSWEQLVAGISQPIFQATQSRLPMLANEKWIQTLRQYLNQSRLQLHIPGIITCATQRMHDVILMEFAIQQEIFSSEDILQINRCRLYLRVQTLADIANAQGNMILSDMYFCMANRFHVESGN